jgi:hypothetical protein
MGVVNGVGIEPDEKTAGSGFKKGIIGFGTKFNVVGLIGLRRDDGQNRKPVGPFNAAGSLWFWPGRGGFPFNGNQPGVGE